MCGPNQSTTFAAWFRGSVCNQGWHGLLHWQFDPRGGMEVAHHRAGKHHTGGSAEHLDDTPADHGRNAARQRATGGAHDEQRQPGRHRAAPDVAVAERAKLSARIAAGRVLQGDHPRRRQGDRAAGVAV